MRADEPVSGVLNLNLRPSFFVRKRVRRLVSAVQFFTAAWNSQSRDWFSFKQNLHGKFSPVADFWSELETDEFLSETSSDKSTVIKRRL